MTGLHDDWSPGDPELAETLPSRYYYDPDIFVRERETIFLKCWHLAAHRNEIAEPGQFVTLDIFDQSVLVARGGDGAVRAFHNVCQHRGNRLVEARRGRIPALFRCGYHAWDYGLDGRLRHAPRSERVKGFDASCIGLKAVRIEEFAGFHYVNLDPGAAPFAAAVPGAEAEIRRHCPDLDGLAFHSETDYIVPANWKVVIDNAIEGYHFGRSGPVHAVLADLIEFQNYTLTPHGAWWTFMGPPKPGTTRAFGAEIDGASYQTDWFFNINLWPHTILYVFPFSDFLGTFLMLPLEPEKTLLRLGYYTSGRALSDVTKSCIGWMNDELGPEDIGLNVSVQKGLRSLGYDRGRYMIDAARGNESEHLLHHFHSLVHAAVWS